MSPVGPSGIVLTCFITFIIIIINMRSNFLNSLFIMKCNSICLPLLYLWRSQSTDSSLVRKSYG